MNEPAHTQTQPSSQPTSIDTSKLKKFTQTLLIFSMIVFISLIYEIILYSTSSFRPGASGYPILTTYLITLSVLLIPLGIIIYLPYYAIYALNTIKLIAQNTPSNRFTKLARLNNITSIILFISIPLFILLWLAAAFSQIS